MAGKNIVISERYRLIGRDIAKVGRGAALAGFGAASVYFFENIGAVDFGEWTPFVAAIISVLANLVRKWINENRY